MAACGTSALTTSVGLSPPTEERSVCLFVFPMKVCLILLSCQESLPNHVLTPTPRCCYALTIFWDLQLPLYLIVPSQVPVNQKLYSHRRCSFSFARPNLFRMFRSRSQRGDHLSTALLSGVSPMTDHGALLSYLTFFPWAWEYTFASVSLHQRLERFVLHLRREIRFFRRVPFTLKFCPRSLSDIFHPGGRSAMPKALLFNVPLHHHSGLASALSFSRSPFAFIHCPCFRIVHGACFGPFVRALEFPSRYVLF